MTTTPTTPPECGTCTQCCTTVAVDELSKPAGVACVHLAPQGGCAIYASRPETCRQFRCGWHDGWPQLSESRDRPDRLGVMFTVYEGTDELAGQHLIRATAAVEPRGRAQRIVKRFAATYLVVVAYGKTLRTIGPDDLLERAQAALDRVRRQSS